MVLKKWDSVSSFIYGNILKTKASKKLFNIIIDKKYTINKYGKKEKLNKKYKNLSKLFNTLYLKEKDNYIIKAITQAYEEILLNNQHDLQKLLIEISNRNIKYISNDSLIRYWKTRKW